MSDKIPLMPCPGAGVNRPVKRIVRNPVWANYTAEQFDEFLEVRFPQVERIGRFVTINAKTLFRCNECGYGDNDDFWLRKPAAFLVAVQYRKINSRSCPRCFERGRVRNEDDAEVQ